MFKLSYTDIYSLMGETIAPQSDDLDLKEIFERKETWTLEKLRGTGFLGFIYVANLLEGKAKIIDSPEVFFEKMVKLNRIQKSLKQEFIKSIISMPVYLLENITSQINKEMTGYLK